MEFVRFRAICDFGDFLDEEFILSVNLLKIVRFLSFFLNSMISVSRTRPEILADAKGIVSSRTTIVEKLSLFAKVVKSKRFDFLTFLPRSAEMS